MSGAKTIRRNCLKEHNKRRIHIIGRLISWFIIFDTRFKCYVGHLTDVWFHDIFPIQLNALCEFMPLMFSMHIICDAFYELATSHLLWLLWILAFILWFIPSILRAIWHQRWPGLHWIGCIDWKSLQWMSQLNHLAERILGETTQFHLNFINIVYMFSVRSLFCQFWLLFGCAHYRNDLSEKGQHQISYIIACWQCFRQNFSKTNNQDNENMRKTKINTPKSAKQNDKTKDGAEPIQTNQVFGVKHII